MKGKSYGHVVQFLWQSCLRNNITPTKALISNINEFVRSDNGNHAIQKLFDQNQSPDSFQTLWRLFCRTYDINVQKESEAGQQ